MGQDRAKRKAELMAKMEALIEAMQRWDEETEVPNLGQMETEILKLRRAFGEELLKDVVTNQESVRPVPRCEQCGLKLLQRAEVVMHDWLISPELLRHTCPGTELIFVGKERGKHIMSQQKINEGKLCGWQNISTASISTIFFDFRNRDKRARLLHTQFSD